MNEEFRRMKEQFNKETALSAEELRQFGITGVDDEDPELLELMKEGEAMFNPKGGAVMKDIDLDKMELDDVDLDDPDLLKEFAELGGEDYKKELEEAKNKLAKIETDIKNFTNQALAFKKQNNIEEAKKYLKKKKLSDEEKSKLLKEYPELASQSASKPAAAPQEKTGPPPAKKESKKEAKKIELKVLPTKVPDIKDVATCDADFLETEVHDVEKMEAISVLEEEIKLMKAKAAKSNKQDAEVYTDKKEALEFRHNMLMNSINSGFTTQDDYMKAIHNELAHEKGLLAMLKRNNAKNEDIKRVETRIKLIESEMQAPEEEEETKKHTEVKKAPQAEVQKTQHREVGKSAPKHKQEVKKEVTLADIKSELVIEEADVDFTKVDKEQYNTVLERLKDYIAATKYFLDNSLEKDAERLVKKVKRLKICLQIVVDGKRIDLLKIEPPLRPETMFGKDLKARIAEFQVLIEKLKIQLGTQEKLAKSYIEKAKKDKTAKALAENEVNNAKETKSLIEKVRANMQNEWQPMPQYKEAVTYTQAELIRKNIGSSEVLIEYTPNSDLASKSGYTMNYTIIVKDEANKGSFDPHKKGEVKFSFPKAIRHIEKGEIIFSMTGKSAIFFSKDIGKLDVKLGKFESVGKIDAKFIDTSGKLMLDIAIMIQKPTKGKEIHKTEHKKIVVTHFYPAYGSANPRPTQLTPSFKNEQEEIKKPAVVKPSPKDTSSKDPPLPASLPTLPAGITEEDVKDPDAPGNLVCCGYLEERIATYNTLIKQSLEKGQAIPSPIKDKLTIMNRNKAMIESHIESGKLTPEKYKELLETQKKKDMILITYLKTLKQNQKMVTVKQRIDCIEKELKSFE